MLTYDALISEAKERGMPESKIRGILREYLQILLLKELYRLAIGKKFCFTGGTYLRLAHRAKRFSEDLDFNAGKLTQAEFETALQKIASAMTKEKFSVDLEFGHWQKLLVAELYFPEVERNYGINSKHTNKKGIVIKFEVNRPLWKIEPETFIINGFGQMFPVVCTQKGALFADKIDALLKKSRARHLYDIIFMIAQRYPVDKKVLAALGIKEQPFEVILRKVDSLSGSELKKQAESLRPFLFDDSETDLLINAKVVIRQLIEQYNNT
jgi:predicted nucleotidyltransferase component of viral defense system